MLQARDVLFTQALPNGGPAPSETYSVVYTESAKVGKSSASDISQAFGVDQSVAGGAFGVTFNESLKLTHTLSWSYQSQSDITTTTSNTGTIYIQGPSCTVVDGGCDPVYDGPTEFNVYQDNLFGTFMFAPAGLPCGYFAGAGAAPERGCCWLCSGRPWRRPRRHRRRRRRRWSRSSTSRSSRRRSRPAGPD